MALHLPQPTTSYIVRKWSNHVVTWCADYSCRMSSTHSQKDSVKESALQLCVYKHGIRSIWLASGVDVQTKVQENHSVQVLPMICCQASSAHKSFVELRRLETGTPLHVIWTSSSKQFSSNLIGSSWVIFLYFWHSRCPRRISRLELRSVILLTSIIIFRFFQGFCLDILTKFWKKKWICAEKNSRIMSFQFPQAQIYN